MAVTQALRRALVTESQLPTEASRRARKRLLDSLLRGATA